jgi:hypothetical protein
MGYEEFRDFVCFEVGLSVWLECKLTKGTFRTIDHCTDEDIVNNEDAGIEGILQREPSPKTSQTRDEQFLDSEGPPPLEVPRNVTDIVPDMIRVGCLL